jgi:serine phosphatase RsbU (regulator of sigma subunit)
VLSERGSISLAARYLPGAQGVDVGGDWYDSIPCGERLALVVGDVVGKGLDAATVMGQLRTSVRVLTTLDPSPAAVLTGLDHAVDRLGGEDVFATLLYLLVDPADGDAVLARAGHMPPLVARPGQPPDYVTDGGSLPLGPPPGPRPQVALALPAGSVVVLFSDGLVECHPDGLRAGLDHLQRALAECLVEHEAGHPGGRAAAAHRPDAEQIAAALLEATPPDRPDDIALLVMVLGPPEG